MAGVSNALKPNWFAGGDNFKRWQTYMCQILAHDNEDLVGYFLHSTPH
jgi:hypothetical protein